MANAKNITKVIVGENLYYLKDKQVRDSIGAANGIATLDSNGKISSSQIPSGIGYVTGVKGDSESSYRTGNVNITKGNIGLGNVGNFKAVSTAASQGLTDTEKSNARANIGAGTGNGTVTGIKMNGASKGTSGVVDLGTVITSHQDISGKADKATTLAGYGITDAKIASGVITLGSNTITPLTSHQDISGKADKSATVSNVAWGSNKLTKTINGTTSDVVTASTIKTALSLAKGDVGLSNVTNDAQVKRSEMGAASGVATLGTDGKVPSSQLPSYVDDVLEYTNKASFPTTGETGKIYVDKATDTTWRWSGSAYTQIKGDLVIGTATGNAADGKVVNDHIGNTSNPHSVTKAQVGLGNVENKSSATIRSEITSSNVTTALGYTPYNSTNPNGYTSNTGTVTGVKVGSSGSTISPSSGVVTIPAYETGAQKHIAPTATEVKSALGTGSGTSKYLREDGTWQTPPDHTYTVNNGTFSLKQKVGSTTTTVADFTANQSGTDDITFIQGSNVTLTADTTNRTITIASTDTNTWRPLGTGASDACAGNDSRLSNSRPASDVYSWAKASTKPTYTASEVGLGNVGNFKAVSTVASQGLSDTEKSNARANIGAGTSSFSGSYNDLSNKPTIPAAANNGTFSVKTKVGSNAAVTAADFTANQSSADDVTFIQGTNVTLTTDTTNRTITIASTDTNTWRPVSDSVSSTSSSDAASSKAVKTAYDLAASKTSNTGTVTKVTAGTGLSGGDITTTGTISLATSGVTAGTYKRVTVDAYGRVTSGDNTDSNTTYKFTIGSTTKGDSTNGVDLGTLKSKTATASGTALSLVTTGEKYTWNNKQDKITVATTSVCEDIITELS